jgi:hypothetical protein
MTNLLPADEIRAFEDGNAREILEATGDQKVVRTDPADAGVWVESG